ncbi:hypothetical protein GSH19_05450 [Lactobacillus sp. S2-2]|uniref:WxL domain-containing protein n=1 Tax=Lactobacillus sp. S2-2 TaxID=2692917 RepID=UPI001F3FCA4A|nr:WxL domain-containing protein [Lactobacillus sp. S2-2]MCF6515598.1 hypothetical protein [Lactobacillus sp. S2-2]
MLFSKKNILALTASALVLGGLSVSASAADTDSNAPTNVIGSAKNADDTGKKQNFYDAEGHQKDGASAIVGKSNAHVRLTAGYLTLNTVPSFGFGASADSATRKQTDDKNGDVNNGRTLRTITDNDSVLKDDSLNGKASSNQLSVTDSRPAIKGSDSLGGYTVTASMAPFGKINNAGGTDALTGDNADAKSKQFILNLKNPQIESSSDKKDISANDNFSLRSDGTTNGSVLSTKKANSGDSTMTFNTGSLYIPEGLTAGNYAASITWTLTPTAQDAVSN